MYDSITYQKLSNVVVVVIGLQDQLNMTKFKLDLFKGKGDLYEAHRNFMKAFKQEWIEWELDYVVLDLVTVLTRCLPNLIAFNPLVDCYYIIHTRTAKHNPPRNYQVTLPANLTCHLSNR